MDNIEQIGTTQPAPPENHGQVNWRHIVLAILCLVVGAGLMSLWRDKEANLLKQDLEEAREVGLDFQSRGAITTPDALNFKEIRSEQLDAPHVLNWVDHGVELTVTGIATGNIVVGKEINRYRKPDGSLYKEGEEFKALRLLVKLYKGANSDACSAMNLRLTNSQGDLFAPLTRQWYFPESGGCGSSSNVTFKDMPIYFAIYDNSEFFEFVSVDKKTLNFTVSLADNKIVGKMISKTNPVQYARTFGVNESIDPAECRNVKSANEPGQSVRELTVNGFRNGMCEVRYISLTAGEYGDYICNFPSASRSITLGTFRPDASCIKKQ